jgi:hypothetical protein
MGLVCLKLLKAHRPDTARRRRRRWRRNTRLRYRKGHKPVFWHLNLAACKRSLVLRGFLLL